MTQPFYVPLHLKAQFELVIAELEFTIQTNSLHLRVKQG